MRSSKPTLRRAKAPGRMPSTTTSEPATRSRKASLPASLRRSSAMLRLPRFQRRVAGDSPRNGTPSRRAGSPTPGCSTLITSAPRSARCIPAASGANIATSTTRTPASSGPLMVNIIHQTSTPPQAAVGEQTIGHRRDDMAAKPATDRTPIDRLSARAGMVRAPGPRAMRTRITILDSTAALLREIPFHQLTSAHITQRAGLSPAAFYRYFADIGDAIAELTARMGDSVQAIAELVRDADWSHDHASSSAQLVIGAMEQFWSEHRPLYRVTDLRAEEGALRSARVRARPFAEPPAAFARVTRRTSRAPRPPLETRVMAGIVVTTLIHTTAREVGFAEA